MWGMGGGVLGVRGEEEATEVLFCLEDESECAELVKLLAGCEGGELSCGEGCVWDISVFVDRGVIRSV